MINHHSTAISFSSGVAMNHDHARTNTRAIATSRRFFALLGALGVLLGATAPTANGVPAATSIVTAVVLPTGALAAQQDAVLNAVSCWSTNNCIGVGSFRTPAGNQLLISLETNGAWGAGPRIALPANRVWSWALLPSPVTELTSISCASATNCLAVGSYLTADGFRPLAVSESGGIWNSAVELALPASAAGTNQDAALLGVNCPSTTDCVAVGTYVDATMGQMPFSLSEHAGTWASAQRPSLPSGALSADQVSELTSIACTSTTSCQGVGTVIVAGNYETMVLTMKSGLWTATSGALTLTLPPNASTPDAAVFNSLNAVTCSAAGVCVAVGQYMTGAGYAAMAATETAGVWAVATELTTPALSSVSGTPTAGLNAVSCTNATSCEAVGTYGIDGASPAQLPFTTTFNGSTWTAGATDPVPVDAVAPTSGELNAVACFTGTKCVRAGGYVTKSATVPDVTTPFTVPGAASAVSVTPGNSTVRVTWSAPLYNGLSAISGYVVTASPGSSSCATTSLGCNVSGLTNGVNYSFTVVASNAIGSSVPSNPPVRATPATVPSAPSIKSIARYKGALGIAITRPVSNGGAPISSYDVSLNAGVTWSPRPTGTTSTLITIARLARHHTYRVAIRARNVMGAGPTSLVVRVTTR